MHLSSRAFFCLQNHLQKRLDTSGFLLMTRLKISASNVNKKTKSSMKKPSTENQKSPQARSSEDRKKLLADLEKQRQDLLNEEVAPTLARLTEVCADLHNLGYQPPTLLDRIKEVIEKSEKPPTITDVKKALVGQFLVTQINKFPLSNAVNRFSEGSTDAKAGKVKALWTADKEGKLSLVSA